FALVRDGEDDVTANEVEHQHAERHQRRDAQCAVREQRRDSRRRGDEPGSDDGELGSSMQPAPLSRHTSPRQRSRCPVTAVTMPRPMRMPPEAQRPAERPLQARSGASVPAASTYSVSLTIAIPTNSMPSRTGCATAAPGVMNCGRKAAKKTAVFG